MAVKKTKTAAKVTGKKGKSKSAPATKTKKTAPAKSSTKKTATKKKGTGRGGFHRELNPDTGFVVGTDSDTIALALLEGGESRGDVTAKLQKVLDAETRNGSEKQVPNMVSGVLRKLLAAGYTVESSFKVNPPTPASKRAASRKANAKSAKPAPAAKKSSTKGKKSAAAKGKKK